MRAHNRSRRQFNFSQAPLQKINEINAKNLNAQPQMLRVSVESGGCSGFSYKFQLTNESEVDDMWVEFGLNGS